MTSDPERARAFYSQLFGWTAEEPNEEFGGYFNFACRGARVSGGMKAMPDAGVPDVWSIYLATDDAAKTAESATAHGGQVVVEPMAVGDLGTMGFVIDAGGAGIGMWQPGSFAGLELVDESSTPAWFELHTRDYDASLDFYRQVFGWETQTMGDSPEFRYTVAKDGEEQVAGVMDASGFLPEGVPAHWSVYFRTDDVDATVARALELGGSVIQPPEDTPYGRLTTLADPMGAAFKLIGPNSESSTA
jgi:predicted enzyme related to lactoylglutathione lyase